MNLVVTVHTLLKKIEDDYTNPKYIVTIYRFGYKFTLENN